MHFSAGHNVQETLIWAGHWVIIAGHCPMSDVYFLACDSLYAYLVSNSLFFEKKIWFYTW